LLERSCNINTTNDEICFFVTGACDSEAGTDALVIRSISPWSSPTRSTYVAEISNIVPVIREACVTLTAYVNACRPLTVRTQSNEDRVISGVE
jgi:hypothetical protein